LENFSENNNKKGSIIWLQEGLKLLKEKGFKNLNIDELSSRTGKAKTSFYHFFTSKSAFLIELALYWEYHYSITYLAEANRISDPMERFDLIIDKASATMKEEIVWIYFKELSKTNIDICQVVERVEKARIKFITIFFTEMNFPLDVAAQKAKLFLYLFFGWSILNNTKEGVEDFKKLALNHLLLDK